LIPNFLFYNDYFTTQFLYLILRTKLLNVLRGRKRVDYYVQRTVKTSKKYNELNENGIFRQLNDHAEPGSDEHHSTVRRILPEGLLLRESVVVDGAAEDSHA
jgi:hypothetical protein